MVVSSEGGAKQSAWEKNMYMIARQINGRAEWYLGYGIAWTGYCPDAARYCARVVCKVIRERDCHCWAEWENDVLLREIGEVSNG